MFPSTSNVVLNQRGAETGWGGGQIRGDITFGYLDFEMAPSSSLTDLTILTLVVDRQTIIRIETPHRPVGPEPRCGLDWAHLRRGPDVLH